MIKIHPVEIALSISTVSLFLFFGISVLVNGVSSSYERQIKEVRRSQNFAVKRLDMTRKKVVKHRSRADSLQVILEAQNRPEVLWTARTIFSETRTPKEMWYVGWVIRNRVESKFLNDETYKEVVLHPKQFSAFNRGRISREYYMNLKPTENLRRWHDAMKIAKTVIDAPKKWRPIPKNTYHFYSEVSMPGERKPDWEAALAKVETPLQDVRFRFYQGKAPTLSSQISTAR